METTHIYLTTEQAIEESKKQDGLIPSEFLSTFPNNFGINLCAVKGFNIEMTEDKQYKSITVDFIPKTEIIERIKKEIIQFLQLPHPQFVGKRNHEEWIAWLEKHKYTEEDLDKAYKCADEVQYRRGYEDAKKELEKQGEQKYTWSKEDERLQQCLIRDQERGLEEVRNDKVGHSEIISDLKEMYRERIDWLESLKERIKEE